MCLAGATQVDQGTRSVELAVRPPGHAEGTLKRGRHSHRLETSAAHRSAAKAGGARPDPFRTRKLSRRAPMVLRGQPVGEQGAADRWTALDPHPAGSGAGAPRGIPPAAPPFSFSPYRSAEGPPGPFFHAARARDRGPVRMRAARIAGGRTAFPRPAIPVPRDKEGARAGPSRSAVYTPLTSCAAASPAVRPLPPANTLLEFRLGLPRALPAWGRGRAHIQALCRW